MNSQAKSYIKSLIHELNGINTEIKTLKSRVKSLNSRKKTVEKDILEFLEKNEQPGVKLNNLAFYQEKKIKRKVKNKSDKRNDCLAVLTNLGIENSQEAYNSILSAMRGGVEEQNSLRIKKLKR